MNVIHCDTATYCNNISHIFTYYTSISFFAGDLSMDGLNEMMDFMDAFTLSSNAQEGTIGTSVEVVF